jgi:AraC-like DNA-binding protein
MKYRSAQAPQKWLTVQSIENGEHSLPINSADDQPTFLLYFIKSGNATLKLPDYDICLIPGSLFWMLSDTTYKIEDRETMMGYCLTLQKPLSEAVAYDPALIYHPHFKEFLFPEQVMQVKLNDRPGINSLFERIHAEEHMNHLFKDEILQGYFKILLLSIVKQLKENSIAGEQRDNNLVKQFQNLLEKDFRSKKFVSHYAEALFIDPNYLNIVMKKVTGHAASYHIKQRIVLEAKRKASYTNMCMKEIAFELGFADIPRFSKYFKTATGINFSAFIQKTYAPSLAG